MYALYPFVSIGNVSEYVPLGSQHVKPLITSSMSVSRFIGRKLSAGRRGKRPGSISDDRNKECCKQKASLTSPMCAANRAPVTRGNHPEPWNRHSAT